MKPLILLLTIVLTIACFRPDGSRLNVAKIEPSILSRQCIDCRPTSGENPSDTPQARRKGVAVTDEEVIIYRYALTSIARIEPSYVRHVGSVRSEVFYCTDIVASDKLKQWLAGWRHLS